MIYFKQKVQSFLLKLIDIPSEADFSDTDIKAINSWLLSCADHRGFIAYLKARDRSFAQTMVNINVETVEGRKAYHEFTGKRVELLRLQARALKVKNDRDSKKGKD